MSLNRVAAVLRRALAPEPPHVVRIVGDVALTMHTQTRPVQDATSDREWPEMPLIGTTDATMVQLRRHVRRRAARAREVLDTSWRVDVRTPTGARVRQRAMAELVALRDIEELIDVDPQRALDLYQQL